MDGGHPGPIRGRGRKLSPMSPESRGATACARADWQPYADRAMRVHVLRQHFRRHVKSAWAVARAAVGLGISRERHQLLGSWGLQTVAHGISGAHSYFSVSGTAPPELRRCNPHGLAGLAAAHSRAPLPPPWSTRWLPLASAAATSWSRSRRGVSTGACVSHGFR